MNNLVWSLVVLAGCGVALSQTLADVESAAPALSPTTSAPAQDGGSAVPAEPDAYPSPPARFLDFINNDRLTGDWGGVRTMLEAKGITLNLHLTSIYQHNAHGGIRTRNGHNITGKVDTELSLDTAAMGLWKGGTFYVFAESAWNDAIDDRVGGLASVNGVAIGDESIRVRALWYEQKCLDDKLRFRVGKLDMASDIDTNAFANWEVEQFLNTSLINASNLPLPDYGLGVLLGVEPVDWMYVTVAAADAQANANETGLKTTFYDEDYFFGALELGLTPAWQTARGTLPGNYRFLLWYDPQPKEVFFNDLGGRLRALPNKRDDLGFVFNMDQMLYKEVPNNEGDTQGLGVFARYAYADDESNLIEHFWSVGAQYQGLIPTRDNDVLGFGFAQSILSGKLRQLEGGDRESVYECYYRVQALPWMHVSPDVQYIVNPGGEKAARDALVVGVRVVMAF